MVVMRPIDEPAVLDELDAGRFGGAASGLRGYVVMEGPAYHGWALFRVEAGTTQVLACCLDEKPLVDGAVRACVAAGENAGAVRFSICTDDALLAEWLRVFCPGRTQPVENSVLLGGCAASQRPALAEDR